MDGGAHQVQDIDGHPIKCFHQLKILQRISGMPKILPGMALTVAEGGCYQLYPHDWIWACGGLPLQVEQPLPILASRMGGDELTYENLLLQKS